MKKLLLSFAISACFIFSAQAQTFSFPSGDTITYGTPTSLISCEDTFFNNSSTGYYIDIVRVVNDTAPFWQTYFCADQCYAWFTDSARFYILPNGNQPFYLDFVTSSMADTTPVLLKFKNVSNPTNTIYQWFYGITYVGFNVNELSTSFNISVYPNPSNGIFNLGFENWDLGFKNAELCIYNMLGEIVLKSQILNPNSQIDLSAQPKGIYFIKVQSGGEVSTQKIVIE